jgi:hypothetical protein
VIAVSASADRQRTPQLRYAEDSAVSDEEAGGKDFSLLQPILPKEHNMIIARDLRSRNQQDDRYYS